jgi:Fungal specific transcription factor domain
VNTSSSDTNTPSTSLGPSPQQSTISALTPDNERNSDSVSLLRKDPGSAGKLIQADGRARFIDNNLWSSLSDEFHPTDAIDDYSSDDDDETLADESNEFVLGLTPNSNLVQHLHPSSDNIFKIWQVFLENVNPMTKIVHYPSLQRQLVKASADLENIPKGLECLMFAIYTIAVGSLDDSECEALLGEARKTLLSRYRHGARRALARARFLGTADLVVLQAFVLYVLSIRPESDARTVWTLAGVANRIAQSMGVHRDGKALGVPPFETELRRRLWWQITILDFRSAELTGSGRFGDISLSDTEVPINVNDSDIWPGMKSSPVASTRPTELVICLLRCEFGKFWKDKLMQKTREGGEGVSQVTSDINNIRLGFANSAPDISTQERDHFIDELEHRLEEKFLRYCEPAIPTQFATSLIARSAINSMRLMAHHPRRYKDESQIPDAERALLWKTAIKLLEGDNLACSTKGLKRFMWHTRVYFQWQALIYILSQLKKHATGEDVDAAWRQIDEIYDNHPEFIIEWRKPLHVAVGGLVLKSWDARVKGRQEAQARGEFMLPLQTPDYIEMLRQHKSMPKKKSDRNSSISTVPPASAQSTSNKNVAAPPAQGMSQEPTPPQADAAMMWETSTATGGFDFNSFAPNPATQYYYDPGISFGTDPNMMSAGSGNDVTMNWTQWDYLLQDFELSGSNTKYGGASMQ